MLFSFFGEKSNQRTVAFELTEECFKHRKPFNGTLTTELLEVQQLNQ